MTTLRSSFRAAALAALLAFLIPGVAAQGDRNPKPDTSQANVNTDSYESTPCPKCGVPIKPPPGKPESFECPHCKAKLKATYIGTREYDLYYTETTDNKWKKPLLYGGGALFVLGVLGMILKYTVFASAKPKKKKKKRRDDDDEDDDRPRKKKPRIVEEDED